MNKLTVAYISRLSDEELIYLSYAIDKEVSRRMSGERKEGLLLCMEGLCQSLSKDEEQIFKTF